MHKIISFSRNLFRKKNPLIDGQYKPEDFKDCIGLKSNLDPKRIPTGGVLPKHAGVYSPFPTSPCIIPKGIIEQLAEGQSNLAKEKGIKPVEIKREEYHSCV